MSPTSHLLCADSVHVAKNSSRWAVVGVVLCDICGGEPDDSHRRGRCSGQPVRKVSEVRRNRHSQTGTVRGGARFLAHVNGDDRARRALIVSVGGCEPNLDLVRSDYVKRERATTRRLTVCLHLGAITRVGDLILVRPI